MNFFVIGLPRSRTAWMANFLTQDRLCYHEGLNGCHTIDEYKKKLGKNNGDSSTGLMLFDMNTLFPESPKLLIRSDVNKAIDYSYRTYGLYDPSYIQYLDKRLNEIEGLHVNVEYLDDRLEEIWNYLIGTSFNSERAEILKRMRIEIKDPHDFDIESMKTLCTNNSILNLMLNP